MGELDPGKEALALGERPSLPKYNFTNTQHKSRAHLAATSANRNAMPMNDSPDDPTPERDTKRTKRDVEKENLDQDHDDLMDKISEQAKHNVLERGTTASDTDTNISSGHDVSSAHASASDLIARPSTPPSSSQDSSPLSSPEENLTPPMPRKTSFRAGMNRKPATKTKICAGEKRKYQTTLDVGQEKITTCNECQLTYSPANKEDKKRHTEHHKKAMVVNAGLDLGAPFIRNADEKYDVLGVPFEGQIVVCNPESKAPVRRQVNNVLEVVTNVLGAVESGKINLERTINFDTAKYGNSKGGMTWCGEEFRYKSFLYVHERRCIGYLLAERIFEANRAVISSSQSSSVTKGARENQVIMGVSRIWVAKDYRLNGVANSLMDNARQYFKYLEDSTGERRKLEHSEIAFSQPTASGMQFVQSFFKSQADGWLVYDEA